MRLEACACEAQKAICTTAPETGAGNLVAGETAVDVAEAPKPGRASWNHGNSMRRGCDGIASVLCFSEFNTCITRGCAGRCRLL